MKPKPTPEQTAALVLAASRTFQVPAREIISRCRIREVCKARLAVYVAMYRGYQTSGPTIARLFNRENSTVTYGIQKAEARAAADAEYAEAIAQIAAVCRG